MEHKKKVEWMTVWCARNGVRLALEGECGFGRECVGISVDGKYPDYFWYNEETWERADSNGDVWQPEDAYRKQPCVAVLGRGEKAEAQLYDWLKWFSDNNFVIHTGERPVDPALGMIAYILGRNRFARMVRK